LGCSFNSQYSKQLPHYQIVSCGGATCFLASKERS
jgi:hypothetical protein